MMRVLFITGSLGGGGAERVIANLVDELELQEIETWIVTVLSNNRAYKINNCTQFYEVVISHTPVIKRLISIKQIKKAINTIKPDVVVSFLDQVNILVSLAFCLTKNRQSKLILSERNDPVFEPRRKIERLLRDLLYRRADGIVFQTANVMEYFVGKIKDETKQIVIENPIKDDLPSYNKNTASKTFIAAGRLNQQKNYKLMIDAFTDVIEKGYDYKLEIYGEGELKNTIINYIRFLKMEQSIEIKSFTSEIHTIMANSYCYLLSSDYEGISNSMIEALAIGIPVISTDYPSGGARRYIKNGVNGFLVPCNDRRCYSNSIVNLINNRMDLLSKGNITADIKNELSVQKITGKWISFIRDLI